MNLIYLFGNLGWIGVLLFLFYLVVLPFMVFGLRGRVKKLEDMMVGEKRPQEEKLIEPSMRAAVPAAAASPVVVSTPKVPTSTITKPAEPTQSLEEKVGAHWFQWIGIAALVAALLFFLKWSFDNGYIGPMGRTMIGYVFVACAIVAGDRLRSKYGTWSLAFTGGGALGSYIVTWIALHTYHLFPSPVAITIYILTTAVTCLLAGYYGALPLAAFGIIGGFVTPLLLGQEGSMLSLLTYILILDVGVLALGHARQWRALNALGLLGTALYQVVAYGNSSFDRTYALAFIAAFFVIYALVPLYYNLLKQQKSESTDLLILIGNALFHCALILFWLGKTPGLRETYDAGVSLGFAVFFLVFSSEVYRRNSKDTPFVLASLALAIFFTTLAIPLQLGGVWVPLAWSLEGAFLFWMALMLRDSNIQRFAWVVMAAAYFWYFFVPVKSFAPYGGFSEYPVAQTFIVFSTSGFYLFLGWMVLFLAALSIGLPRADRKQQNILPFVFVGGAVLMVTLGANLFMKEQSTLTGLQRFIEAMAMIGGGYFALVQAHRHWAQLDAQERKMFSSLGVVVQIITLVYLTDEFVRAVNDRRIFASFQRPHQVVQVGMSILWAVYGALTLTVGIFKNWKPLRLFSLVVVIIAMGKLTLVDLTSLGTGYRVIGFTILGAVLVSASFLYQRQKEAFKSFFVSPS